MKGIDFKVLLVAAFLIVIALVSIFNWECTSIGIFNLLKSERLLQVIMIFIGAFLLIHFFRNKSEPTNQISDKEGLEKPVDYLQFFFTYLAIAATLQTTARELFAHFNFSEQSKCKDFDNFDCFGFLAVIVVLSHYSYGKIKPMILESIKPKNKIRPTDEKSA